MKPIKFHTENFESEAKKVGEVIIGNEMIPIHEIIVNIKENKIEVILPYDDEFADSNYEQEFLDAVQKLLNEIQKEDSSSLAFIYSDINRYCFWNNVDGWGSDNPVKGFLQAWRYGPDGGEWLTWMKSPAVADKREKGEAFRTAFEKWALAKFLQLVFGDKSLPFVPPYYGSEDTVKTIKLYFSARGFGNGAISLGKMNAYNYWSKVCGHQHNLYAIWDEERDEFLFDYDKTLTEEELEQLHKDLTEKIQ